MKTFLQLCPSGEAMSFLNTPWINQAVASDLASSCLYDIGYDNPKTHVIQKSDTLFCAFKAKEWKGE